MKTHEFFHYKLSNIILFFPAIIQCNLPLRISLSSGDLQLADTFSMPVTFS